jgi:hypothetical protein
LRNSGAVEGTYPQLVAHAHHERAATWVAAEIARLRSLTYDDLLALQGLSEHQSMETDDRKTLGMESQVVFDDREQRNLRVLVDAWDASRLFSRSIARADFIKAPDGSFVGE